MDGVESHFKCLPFMVMQLHMKSKGSEPCEVTGQILLHGVSVMLHWLVRETKEQGKK